VFLFFKDGALVESATTVGADLPLISHKIRSLAPPKDSYESEVGPHFGLIFV
jgi:hypothetical protein